MGFNDLGARNQWKSWNITVIQWDSGESRTSVDVAELESKETYAALLFTVERGVGLRGMDFDDISVP